MNSNGLLEATLRDILISISPLDGDWSVRHRTLNNLRVVVESIESLRGATVEPFGSFASNLFTRWGDLDIFIELPNGSCVASLGKRKKQSFLIEVRKALIKKGGWGRIEFIAHAKVPILMLESGYGFSCDVSISNLVGQMKSKVLLWINEIDGRFRLLVLLVKEWAKGHNINNPKFGTFNSYSLSLLVIFHLQTLEPAILPPFREIYPGNMSDDLTGERVVAVKQVEDICGLNITRYKLDAKRLINHSSLAELFVSFLAKFADICSRASEQGINLYAGRLEDIGSNRRWLLKNYSVFIEDPLEQPVNTARSVASSQLGRIAEAIQRTHRALISPHQNRNSLVSILVRQRILHMVATKHDTN